MAEVWVRSGKEETLVLALERSPNALAEVEVTGIAPQRIGTMSAHTLTVEQSLRYPATFFDPARLAMSYAGVASTNDQANHFSVRGNGPVGNAWLLEGAEIVTPNHLTNAGTASDLPTLSGGGTTILSAQMLGTSRLLTGGLSAGYGNAVGGIMDLRLRPGINSRHAFTVQAGLIGIDLSAEGPFRKGGKASYLVNYRYSTLGLLSAMGVALGDEAITFQDLSFNVSVPMKRSLLTLFGMGGTSSNRFMAKDSVDQEFEKDDQNIDYTAKVGVVGGTFRTPIGANAVWNSTVVLSENDQERIAEHPEFQYVQAYTETAQLNERKLSLVTQVNGAIGSRTTYRIGGSAMQRTLVKFSVMPEKVDTWLLRPFVQGAYSITERLRAEVGVAYAYYRYNGSTIVEPRAALQWSMRAGRTVTISAGQRGQIPQVQLYAIGEEGSFRNNRQIGFTRSQELVLAYHHPITSHVSVHVEGFYQQLSDVPVADADYFLSQVYAGGSLINAWNEPFLAQLMQTGKATNKGIELSIDHPFHRGYFYQLNGTILNADYTDLGGATHDSRWNIGGMGNMIVGREFAKEKEGGKRTWGVNGRLNVTGGQRYSPYALFAPGPLEPFTAQYDPTYRLDLRVYLKRERNGHTGMWSLDLLNATNAQNVAYKYFDGRKFEVVTKYQLGLIPNLSYRIEF